MSWFLSLSLTFVAGAIGGLANALVVWFFGIKGIKQFFKVNIAPKLDVLFIYSKIVWGGLWGVLFIFALDPQSLFLKATLISLAPTLVQLFYIFPKQGLGTSGLKLGSLTPALVIFFNLVWAYAGATWIYFALLK